MSRFSLQPSRWDRTTAASEFGLGHPPVTRALAMFLVVVLLTSSLLIISSGPGDAQSVRTPSGAHEEGPQEPAGSGQGHSEKWDWGAMADQSGRVNVILWENGPQSIGTVVDQLEGRPGSAGSAGLNVSFLHQHSNIKSRFAGGFEGLSVNITPEALEQLLSSEPNLEAYPDLTVKALDLQTDQQIGANVMWNRTDTHGKSINGAGITVAVIDTGICYTHPDLGGGIGPGHKVYGGYDFYNNDSDPMDDNGHGTHVAGIIAASGGIKGVAPGASLLAYKALGADGSGTMSAVIQSIDAAMDPNGDGSTSDHADVISMSLGGDGDPNDPLCLAVDRAIDAGVVVVIAAGNSGPSSGTVMSPGLAPLAITVGAVDGNGALANFSSRGPTADLQIKPEISAPGVKVVSTVPYSGTRYSSSTGYMPMSGTSMATPHASGAVALLLQAHPDWTPVQVKSALVSGAKQLGSSFWSAGAGEVWVPSSADVPLLSTEPLFSLGIFNGTPRNVTVRNLMQGTGFSARSSDWNSLSADASTVYHDWSNFSSVSPASVTIATGTSRDVYVSVSVPSTCAQGYYGGYLTFTSGSTVCRLPFGFIVLSRINVHVIDTTGREVRDPYGGVWVYPYPSAGEVMQSRGGGASAPSPPSTFLVPAGQYAVQAAGRQLLYSSKGPYILSAVFTVGCLETRDVNLTMSSAHVATMNLETSEGNPIYVRDFRLYSRYAGVSNVTLDLVASDLSTSGSGVFSLPHSVTVYVSDTQATIGFSITGYAYSRSMWNFMSLNWNHWYEYIGSSSTNFKIPATADLEYLLAWEFPHVDSSFPSVLTYDANSSSVYVTKYDIPGTIVSAWCMLGTHEAMGGGSASWIRRDTSTSVNPLFSGMTRTVIVSGVYSEVYYPGALSSGYLEREFYVPDYSHVTKASTPYEIYIPDRNYVTTAPLTNAVQRIGAGPFYPSVRTANTNSCMVLFQPLLRDQWGSKVGGMTKPVLSLSKDATLVGSYQLTEYLTTPDAERVFSLSGPGRYSAQVSYSPFLDISNNVTIGWSFSIPSMDPDPPMITGLTIPQRFVPGDKLPLTVSAVDAISGVTVGISSRSGDGAPWVALKVNTVSAGSYTATVTTSAADSVVDLKITVKDSSGNYLNYTAYKVAEKETPVQFDIRPSVTQLDLSSTSTTVVLTGYLRSSSGGPLNPTASVPLELWSNGKKIGMILDDYVTGTTHVHNGTIRFEWILNPNDIFTSAGQTVDVTVSFDIGTYSPVTRTFTLTSIGRLNSPPVITLNSPAQGSLVAAGTQIDLSITDDMGIMTAGYSVDSSAYRVLSSPWDISTSGWTDATHIVRVYATDADRANTTLQFSLGVDVSAPSVTITAPLNGSIVPVGSSLVISASDSHLSSVSYSADGAAPVTISAPYAVSLSSWSMGWHSVTVTAMDAVGHVSTARTTFDIVSSTVVVSLVSPSDGSVIKSGVPIALTVLGSGTLTCSWNELGVSHVLPSPYTISTSGWTEGTHMTTVSASNNLGGHYQITFNMTIDNTPPKVTLDSPANGTFVTTGQSVNVTVDDAHYRSVSWTIAGITSKSTDSRIVISLDRITTDGYYTINITASDLANNTAREQFTFAVDCNAPIIQFNGAANGIAIMPGAPLSLTASDMFLVDVWLSIDGGAWQSVIVPSRIDTSNLSFGWHTLQAAAEDSVGHDANDSLAIYIDGTPIKVSMVSGTTFTINAAFNVTASLTDDSMVSSAVLFYSLPSGGFDSMPMTQSGSFFNATLSADEMWDGMTVYVVATDGVGHSTEGIHEALYAAAGSPTGGHSGISSGIVAQASWLSASAVAILLIVLLVLFQVTRKRDEEERVEREQAEKSMPVSKSADEQPEAGKRTTISLAGPAAKPVLTPALPGGSTIRQGVVAAEPSKHGPFSVLDDIPLLHISSENPTDVGYRSFMTQLEGLQREMTALQEKRSVFQTPDDKSLAEFEKELDLEEPQIVRGMKLKSLLK